MACKQDETENVDSSDFECQNGITRLPHKKQIRKVVLQSFSETPAHSVEHLSRLSPMEWKRLLPWLDVSGLALYLLERLNDLGKRDILPPDIAERLQQNRNDNIQRTRGMIEESIAIQLAFQRTGLSYAVMKGISLSPWSVPQPELRHQFDLDYLIDESSAPMARKLLEQRGYHLFAISGRSWEFKIHETPFVSMKDLYKDLAYRGVELHLEHRLPDSRLKRVELRPMYGITMPVFCPVDLFLGQAMHAFKDVSSAFFRASHLLEFYRHVLARRDDLLFWNEVRQSVESTPRIQLGLGIMIDLITVLMGNFAPEALTSWTVDQLPPSLRLWVDLYGHRAAFSNPPGSKLYLFLQRELAFRGISGTHSTHQSLLPLRLPPAVIQGSPDEPFLLRLGRYRIQIRFIASRLRFHIAEGLRYIVESRRWRHNLDQLI